MSVVADLRVLDYGDCALLLPCDSTAEVLAWTAALRRADLAGVVDIVPAAKSVLIQLEAHRYQPATRHRIEQLGVVPDTETTAEHGVDVVIDVVYDGEDLEEVGRVTGLGPDGVIAAHTGTPWRVAFAGFAPGFAYLAGGDR